MIETNTIYNEPCLETLSRMPDNYLDCVITSPPYWQLRDYGYAGQWGLEPTYADYLANLWNMIDEIHRVLKQEGTVWVNLGDTYGTQSGNMRNLTPGKNTDYNDNGGIHFIQPKSVHKSLLLLPHRFAIGCMDRGWIIRNDCIWAKSNCMPESVTDRFSKKHEYFFFMVKSDKYFFDLDAVRDKYKTVSIERSKRGLSENHKWVNGCAGKKPDSINKPRPNRNHNFGGKKLDGFDEHRIYSGNEWTPRVDGKNPGDVSDFWDIPTKGSSSDHYASYNDELLKKPILAGCPEGGIIYDPFMGTGSTAECALRANRLFIGSEMNKRYCEIANKRLMPFLVQTQLL